MAEDQQEEQELTDDEITELEDSLDDIGDEGEPAKATGLKGILSNKKLLMIFGGGHNFNPCYWSRDLYE